MLEGSPVAGRRLCCPPFEGGTGEATGCADGGFEPIPLLRVRWLGRLPYTEAWDLQRAFHEGKVLGRTPDDYLLLLEHPPVFTIGRNGSMANLLATQGAVVEAGAEIHHVDRGGDITFHGPGQLVGYPILTLNDPKQIVPYVRRLEEALIRTLAGFGVESWAEPGLTGVWTTKGKVAAIGVKVARRVTMHGFALNLHPEMSYFGMMNPCGITDREVTTVSELVGRRISLEEVVEALIPVFAEVFGYPDAESQFAAFVRGQGKSRDFEVDRLLANGTFSAERRAEEPVLNQGEASRRAGAPAVDAGHRPHGCRVSRAEEADAGAGAEHSL